MVFFCHREVMHGVAARCREETMTAKRNFKRRVRERQARTGERYTTARRRLQAARAEAGPSEAIASLAPASEVTASVAPASEVTTTGVGSGGTGTSEVAPALDVLTPT